MAKTVTLLQLRTQVRQRTEMENSTFVSDAELTGYINNSIGELYDILTQKFGNDYYATSTTFSTSAGTESYSLPATFYKLLGVDALNTGTEYFSVKPFMFSERNRWNRALSQSFYGLTDYRYQLRGSSLYLIPTPQEVRTIRLWYVPAYTTLVADADTLDGVNGYEEYVIVDAAIKCLGKEESDVSLFVKQKDDLLKRIEAAAQNRDAGEPMRMVDVRGYGDSDPEGAWGR